MRTTTEGRAEMRKLVDSAADSITRTLINILLDDLSTALADLAKERERAARYAACAAERQREIAALRAELDECLAELERWRSHNAWLVDNSVKKGQEAEAAEARAERLQEAAEAMATFITEQASYPLSYGGTFRDRTCQLCAALAETAPKTSERDGREGRGAVAPSPDVQLHPSRPAEAPIEPGTSSPDDAEISALEWYDGGHRGVSHCCDECLASLAALLRIRDAQAREAGRAEGWNEAVEETGKLVDGWYEDAREMHSSTWPELPNVLQEVRDEIRALKRPDRAK